MERTHERRIPKYLSERAGDGRKAERMGTKMNKPLKSYTSGPPIENLSEVALETATLWENKVYEYLKEPDSPDTICRESQERYWGKGCGDFPIIE